MMLIDDKGLKYRAIKKNGEYYLITEHTKYKNTGNKIKYARIEVKGKNNVFTYIKNNDLKEYIEEEWFYE